MIGNKLRRRLAKRWLKRAITLSVLSPVSVWAQSSNSLSVPARPRPKATASVATATAVGENRAAIAAPSAKPLRKELFGQVRFESMQYMADVPEAPSLTRSQFLSARLSALGSFDSLPAVSYAGDFAAGTFFRRSQSEFVVDEAYLSSKWSPNVTVSLGRKKAAWSELDSRWQLGLWQPRYAIDSLRPEEQGLTGAFVEITGRDFELVGYASPVFIPTMGPDVREDGGSLKSDSRWWRQPSSKFDFSNRINSINYKLDIPATAKLVGNPGAGVRGRVGATDRGPWAGVAGAYKPINDLVYRRQNFKSATADMVDVTISPDVGYHNILSADVGYAGETMQVSASYLQDRPRDKKAEVESSVQRLQPLKAYSAQFDWMIRDLFSRTVQLRMGYLRVNGGGIVDVTQDGPDDFTMFDSRLIFTNAASVSLQGEIARFGPRTLVAKTKYLYDWDQAGSLVNAEFLFYPARSWALVAGADVLGVNNEKKDPSGFLNQFRANDRVYGGMTYVF